ncbi:hypothetical protein ACWD4N_33820 [Streptomyces sp. NPDC002586]
MAASRAQGRRALLARGWVDLAPIDDVDLRLPVRRLTAALTPETRARARAAAGAIRTDGATVAAHLLLDAVSHN